jgi:hypothetical protein
MHGLGHEDKADGRYVEMYSRILCGHLNNHDCKKMGSMKCTGLATIIKQKNGVLKIVPVFCGFWIRALTVLFLRVRGRCRGLFDPRAPRLILTASGSERSLYCSYAFEVAVGACLTLARLASDLPRAVNVCPRFRPRLRCTGSCSADDVAGRKRRSSIFVNSTCSQPAYLQKHAQLHNGSVNVGKGG